MKKELLEELKDYVLRNGAKGRRTIAVAIDRGERAVDRFLKEETNPTPHQCYQMAYAIGLTEKRAKQLSKED